MHSLNYNPTEYLLPTLAIVVNSACLLVWERKFLTACILRSLLPGKLTRYTANMCSEITVEVH